MAIQSFKDQATEDINYGVSSKAALRLLPKVLHEKAQITLARLGVAASLLDLQQLRGNRLEALKGQRKGDFSTRINDQYRICIRWKGEHSHDVEIIDYHCGKGDRT